MILLDTGYLIALFDANDALHDRAMAWSERIDEPLLVTEHVLWETVNYFSSPADRSKAHALIEHIRSEPACEIVWQTPDYSRQDWRCIGRGRTNSGP